MIPLPPLHTRGHREKWTWCRNLPMPSARRTERDRCLFFLQWEEEAALTTRLCTLWERPVGPSIEGCCGAPGTAGLSLPQAQAGFSLRACLGTCDTPPGTAASQQQALRGPCESQPCFTSSGLGRFPRSWSPPLTALRLSSS